MVALLVVGSGVPMRGIITAADFAAIQANPKVHPVAADLQTLFTAGGRTMDRLWGRISDVFAGV